MHIRMGKLKKAVCAGLCAVLLMGNSAAAMAADLSVGEAQPTAEAYSVSSGNITYCGDLQIEAHLQSRPGYSRANYAVYITAPSNVVGMMIDDGEIKKGNVISFGGTVSEVSMGNFGTCTVKVTEFYEDAPTHSAYVTIDLNHRCGGTHSLTDRCMP